jgi:hypothetical protein
MFPEMTTAERNQARWMRYEGRSIKEIARLLRVLKDNF